MLAFGYLLFRVNCSVEYQLIFNLQTFLYFDNTYILYLRRVQQIQVRQVLLGVQGLPVWKHQSVFKHKLN